MSKRPEYGCGSALVAVTLISSVYLVIGAALIFGALWLWERV